MPQAIAAAIEAIFVLLGSPDLEVREMALSDKKFQGMLASLPDIMTNQFGNYLC